MTKQTHIPEKVLYKYLDINGAKEMLSKCNIQFTNATKLNDPLDCHPGLVDNSDEDINNITPERLEVLAKTGGMGYFPTANRAYTYLCSLSMIFDSILMWSYYAREHKGVCVGLNMQRLQESLKFISFYVEYPNVLTKHNCHTGTNMEAFKHQLATKAPDWKHENEVRLLLCPQLPPCEDHFQRPIISGDCFDSIHLGVNMDRKDKEDIIVLAKQLNSNVKIYKMQIDPDAFKLNSIEIT